MRALKCQAEELDIYPESTRKPSKRFEEESYDQLDVLESQC